MRISLLGHHDKHLGIEAALRRNDFEFCDPYGFNYEAVLADTDHPYAVPYPEKHAILKECARRGIPIILYPHGAMPDLDLDGLRPQALPISLQLVHGEGHAEVNRRIGLKHRTEVVGWSFCEQIGPDTVGSGETLEDDVHLPSAASTSLGATKRRVNSSVTHGRSPSYWEGRDTSAVDSLLFAPIHPWANGQDILPFHKGLNTAAYHQFLQHPAEQKTVRMYGNDEPNGVTERVAGVEYTQSDLGNGLDVIDAHDAVISYGTFAYNALARGKPVAMIYPFPAHTDDHGQVHARRFSEYEDYCRYPASLGDADLDELFSRDVSEWKRLFVGGPLDAGRVCELVGSFKANRAQRRKLERMR